MKRKVIITTTKQTPISAEKLYSLTKSAFKQWEDNGLIVPLASFDYFARYMEENTVFVAHDIATGELLAMRVVKLNPVKGSAAENNLSVAPNAKRQGIGTQLIEAEVEWLVKAGYRYTTCFTATTATWSVKWHLKNGYYIVGYSRSEGKNYASYIFRKQIATDVRHHPTDLLWTKPIASLTAKLLYCLSWLATNICKSKSGKLNWIGRMAKDVRRLMSDG